MTVEKLVATGEFDENPELEKIETEKQFTLVEPFFFDFLKHQCEVQYIEQIYVSNPSEPYSLRLRQTTLPDGQTSYSSTLKERGRVVPNGLRRQETPTQISKSSYEFYQSQSDNPRLFKQRAMPAPGVSVDWIDGWDQPIVEIEDFGTNEEAQFFYQMYRDQLVDKSGDKEVDSEYIAHVLSGKNPNAEADKKLDAGIIAGEILAYQRAGVKNLVVGISGRSGSGKTTMANEVEQILASKQISSALVATDSYHFGKRHLDGLFNSLWTNWDSAETYDTKTMAFDLWTLLQGNPIDRREFDFRAEEPVMNGVINPADVIIVEGIHAGSPDLDKVRRLHFNMPTPIATCIGRDLDRLRRLGRANGSIGSPEARLRYQIEVAEPTYQSLKMPTRNTWSASIRPMGSAAIRHESLLVNAKGSGA